jgi:hypothetical protein
MQPSACRRPATGLPNYLTLAVRQATYVGCGGRRVGGTAEGTSRGGRTVGWLQAALAAPALGPSELGRGVSLPSVVGAYVYVYMCVWVFCASSRRNGTG